MKKTKEKVLIIRLTEEEHAALKIFAVHKHTTMSKYIRGLLYDAIRKEKDLGF